MTLNTELVERVMGYDYGALRSNLMGHGATMCGVSGMGPALAVLVPRPKIDAVVAFLPQRGGEVRRARIRRAESNPGRGSMTVQTIRPAYVHGRRRAPPSKSYTHRALIAAFSGGKPPPVVEGPLDSDDTRATRIGLRGAVEPRNQRF